MTEYHWPELYERAVHLAKGDRPGIELEGRIVQAFTEDPKRVDRAIERIGNSYARGDIHSFWAVLDTDLAAPAGPRFTTIATAKQPPTWHSTNARSPDPELPPAPRKIPQVAAEFMARHWPKTIT